MPCGNKCKDIHLQTSKKVCVLVAVVLKKVHNLLKEILKNRRNVCFFSKEKKEKALSPSNPACRLNKIVWNHCFDSHWLKARVALLVKLLNLLWFKHLFFSWCTLVSIDLEMHYLILFYFSEENVYCIRSFEAVLKHWINMLYYYPNLFKDNMKV